MNSSVSFIVIAVLAMTITVVSDLQCYSCESQESEACGRNPTEADRITCDVKEFCIVKRSERSDFTVLPAALERCTDWLSICAECLKPKKWICDAHDGRNVTILRGCGLLSTIVSAIGTVEYQVGISVFSQSCSTDLCNTGNGLGTSGDLLFPGFNISNDSNDFGFVSNNFAALWNDFKKAFDQTFGAFGQSEIDAPVGKRMVLKDFNVPTSLKMFGVELPRQISSFDHPQPIKDADKRNRFIAAGNDKSRSAPIAWLRAPQSRNNPLQQRFRNVAQRTNDME